MSRDQGPGRFRVHGPRPRARHAGLRGRPARRDDLEQLKHRLDLTLVHVLERPPADWDGETGYIRADVLARHLPSGHRRFQFFICGPDPMMDAAQSALLELRVPAERVHTERFDMA